MSANKAQRPRIYIENKTVVERIVPELATEIGLNESILLLQLDFWIGQADNYRDGRWWTYQSTREMQSKAFPYWGIGTIHRTVVSLEKMGLIITGNFNKRPGDNTRWFALDSTGLRKLSRKCHTIQFVIPEQEPETEEPEDVDYTQQLEQGSNGVGTPRSKMEQPVPERNTPFQNGTTLPEITTEKTQKRKRTPPSKKPTGGKHEPNPMYDAVFDIFKLTAGMNTDMQKMLQGTATKKGYVEYNLDEPIDAAELREWGEWYRRTELGGDPNLSMVKKHDKIQSSIGYWQAKKKERAARLAAAQAQQDAYIEANKQSGSYSPRDAEPDGSKPTPENTPLSEDRKAAMDIIIGNTVAMWGVKRASA